MARRLQSTTARHYATCIVLAVVVFAVLLVGPEMVARLVGLDAGWSLRSSLLACVQRSASLRSEFVPNCSGNLRGTSITTNSQGFRSAEVRDDGSRRVLALGDSCTFGWGVEQDETYPAVLENLLNDSQVPDRYQVINAGHSGYTAYHGRVLLGEKGLALRPDIVTIGFGFNAMMRTGDVEEKIKAEADRITLLRIDDFFIERSKLYAWARWETRPRTDEEFEDHPDSKSAELMEPQETPDKYEANLRRIVSMSRKSDAKVLLVSFWGERVNDYSDRLAEISRDLDVPLITYRGPRLDVVHPTKEGYRVFAKRILETFNENQWLN